jgi:hypothetical protein
MGTSNRQVRQKREKSSIHGHHSVGTWYVASIIEEIADDAVLPKQAFPV